MREARTKLSVFGFIWHVLDRLKNRIITFTDQILEYIQHQSDEKTWQLYVTAEKAYSERLTELKALNREINSDEKEDLADLRDTRDILLDMYISRSRDI